MELATTATEEAFIATQCGPAVPLPGLTVAPYVSLLRMLSAGTDKPCNFKYKFRGF